MSDPSSPRDVGAAMLRGARGLCPVCGRGRLLEKYLKPRPRCLVCDANLAPYQTADFAAYIVMFVVGLVATPFVFAASVSSDSNPWSIAAVMAGVIVLALLLLPPVKGAIIALLWALDIRSNI